MASVPGSGPDCGGGADADEQRAVSASDGNTVNVWDLATGRLHCDSAAFCYTYSGAQARKWR
jgi:hypothetical protein